jgi:plastocyanin
MAIVSGVDIGALGPAGALAGSHPEAGSNGGPRTVVVEMIGGVNFEPMEITIRAGDTVEWRNIDMIRHSVTIDRSRALDPDNVTLPFNVEPIDKTVWGGEVFRYRFTEPGVYRYVCLPHERLGMIGSVVVEPVG